MMSFSLLAIIAITFCFSTNAFLPTRSLLKVPCEHKQAVLQRNHITISRQPSLQMNFFADAARFFSNMNKEASAKHILIKGQGATEKLKLLKEELSSASAEELSSAFSELASKVSECPSATRGGNLGTFKPGMMVAEFDKVVFENEVGVVHGPVQTQFGSHLILITRRYEGEDKK